MAKEIVLNLKVNNEGAKSIGELKGVATQTLKTLNDMEEAAAQLNAQLRQTEVGTAEYKELSQQLRIVNTELKNSDLALEALDNEQLGSSIKGLAGGLTDVAGGLALIGLQGESIEKIAATFAQVEGLSKIIGGTFDVWNEGLKVVKAGQTAAAAASATLTAATLTQSAATKGAAVQQGILNTVMNANPVFLLITAVGALVGAFALFSKFSGEAAEAEKKRAEETKKAIAIQKAKKAADDEARKSIAAESTAFVGLIYQLKETNKNSTERSKLIKQINSQYGTTLKNLSDEAAFQQQLNLAVKQYIAFQTLKVRQERADKYTTDLINKQLDAQNRINKALKEVTASYGFTKIAANQYQQGANGEIFTLGELRSKYFDLNEVLLKNERIVYDTESALEGLGASQLQIKAQIDDITNAGKTYVDQAPTVTAVTDENTRAYSDASDAIEKLIAADERLAAINREIAEYEFGENLESAINSQLESIQKSGQYSTEVINMVIDADKKRTDEIIRNDAAIQKSKTDNAVEIAAIDKEMNFALTKNNDTYVKLKKDSFEKLETAQEDYAAMVSQTNQDTTQTEIDLIAKRKVAMREYYDDLQQRLSYTKEVATAVGDIFAESFAGSFEGIEQAFANLSDLILDPDNGIIAQLQNGTLGVVDAIAMGIQIATEALAEFSQAKLEEQLESSQALYEEQSNQYAEALANREITQAEYDAKVKQLEQQKRDRDRKADQDAFKRAKTLALVNAAVGTAQAVINAFSSGAAVPIIGAATGAVYAGIAGALGAAQIAIIASQQYKAARGGIVPGTLNPEFDSVPALLAPGEAVINSRSAAMYPELLSEINQVGGGVALTPARQSDNKGGMQSTDTSEYGNTKVIEAVVSEQTITATQESVDRQKRRQRFLN